MPAVSGLSRTNAMDTNVITVEVQKLDLKPGDILALRVDRSLDKTQLDAIRACNQVQRRPNYRRP
jgi:hypothetical protein